MLKTENSKEYFTTAHNRKEESVYANAGFDPSNLNNRLPICNQIPNTNRDRCIKELVDTERNYINCLNMISRYFMRPLRMLMKPEDYSCLFSQIKLISDLHTAFYADMYNCVDRSGLNNACISDLFFDWGLFFMIYGKYVTSIDKAQCILADLIQKSSYFNEIRLKCEEQSSQSRFKLADLIALPFQRILKYHLLLREIAKMTPESHPDYGHLERAHKFILDINDYLNETKRDSEMIDKIHNIERNMIDLKMSVNTSFIDYGRLLKNEDIKVKSSLDDNKIKTRHTFLFERAIVMCKAIKATRYIFKDCFLLSDFELISDANAISGEYKPNVFCLVHTSGNLRYTFYPKTEDAKRKWVQAIEKALDSTRPNACKTNMTDHKFVVQSFEKGSFCDQCELLFKGLYYQGYKCTTCSTSVHKNCIPKIRACSGRPKSTNQSPTILRLRRKYSMDETFRLKIEGQEPVKSAEKQIEDQDWYAHTMKRDVAERILMQMANNSYLVRISTKQAIYAISVKDVEQVKHIYVLENERNQFYLIESKCFDDLVDLINFYSNSSLADTLHGLTIALKFPYKKCFKLNITNENSSLFEGANLTKHTLSYCKGTRDFKGNHPLLSFKKGDLIDVLDKKAEPKGFWKARIGQTIGYIPVKYVGILDKDRVILKDFV